MQRVASAMFAAAFLLTGCSTKIVQNEPKPFDNTIYTRESADIRLQDDFYGYMNFDLLYGSDIPTDMKEISAGRLVEKRVDSIINDEILNIAHGEKYPVGSDEQKIHDLYLQCLDCQTRDDVGLVPLEKGFAAIEEAQTPSEFVRACGMLYTNYGVDVLPAVYASQNHFDSSKYIVSLGHMELFYSVDELLNGKDSAEELQRQLALLLEVLEKNNSDALAYDIVTILLDIAECTADLGDKTIEEMYNIRKQSELPFLIEQYIESVGIIGRDIVVYDPEQLDRICSLLTDDNLPQWKSLAECELFYRYMNYLPNEYSETLGAVKQSDEEKALNAVKALLEDEVGNIYARKYFDKTTFSAVKQMTGDIISAYRENIKNSELLSASECEECLAKIDRMTVNIGCPDEEEHSSSEVSGSFLDSVVSIKSSAVRERLSKLDDSPKPTDWYIMPQTLNALCRPQSNSITVPMALFNAPYFDVNADYYTNLGGLGSIIAHEIGHAFDAEGIMYDEFGNYSPERISSERIKILSNQVEEYFGSKQIMRTFYINGEHTKLENAADLGGMQVIASMTDNWKELKLIFESYANIWATLSFDTDASKQVVDDIHSPAEIRVNAVLSCVDKFYETYGIAETDGMYIPPDKRVRLW